MTQGRLIGGFFAAAFLFATGAQAQCTGWPVQCAPIHPGVGGGGMGSYGASAAIDIGFTLFSAIIEQMQQQPPPSPDPSANAPASNGSYYAAPAYNPPAPAAPTPLTLQEKSSLLGQMRPVGRGGYVASAPSSPSTTSAVEADKASLLGQMRPITATSAQSIGGAGVSGSPNPQQAMQQAHPSNANSKLNGPDERASANAQKPFDTAGNQPAHSAADQLCQAAGRANGCIGSFTGSGQPGASAPKLNIKSTDAGIVFPQPPRRVCGTELTVAGPMDVTGPDPLRAGGFPIANTPDELRALDYSDIRANLRAMTPAQLAKMRQTALQGSAKLAGTIDAMRSKLFVAGLSAAIPIDSFPVVARQATLDWLKDTVPFWKQIEEAARGEEKDQIHDGLEDLKKAKEYLENGHEVQEQAEKLTDFLDKSRRESDTLRRLALDKLAKQRNELEELLLLRKAKPPELPGLGKLLWSHEFFALDGSLAIGEAAEGHWADASGYAGKAVKDLRPLADLVLPDEMLLALGKWEGPIGAVFAGLELGADYESKAMDKQEKLDKKARGQELTLALTTRLDALKGKQRDLDNLVKMIDGEPRCR